VSVHERSAALLQIAQDEACSLRAELKTAHHQILMLQNELAASGGAKCNEHTRSLSRPIRLECFHSWQADSTRRRLERFLHTTSRKMEKNLRAACFQAWHTGIAYSRAQRQHRDQSVTVAARGARRQTLRCYWRSWASHVRTQQGSERYSSVRQLQDDVEKVLVLTVEDFAQNGQSPHSCCNVMSGSISASTASSSSRSESAVGNACNFRDAPLFTKASRASVYPTFRCPAVHRAHAVLA
jgi:hypothetical protein